MNASDDATGVLVQERVDGHFQRSDNRWIFRLFDDFDVDPGIRVQRRTAIVEDEDLQVVTVSDLVVESFGSA